MVQHGGAAVAVLLNPTRVEQVFAVADAGDVMPPKSTYFVPKVPSGLVLRPLSEGGDQRFTELRQVGGGARRDEVSVHDDRTVLPNHAGILHVVFDGADTGRSLALENPGGDGDPPRVTHESDRLTSPLNFPRRLKHLLKT